MLESRETIENRILYTGQQYDQETGQYYLRARFYNPAVGRFMQEDTYRGDGLNLYAYCGNNPLMYYDPSGHSMKDYETKPTDVPEKPKVAGEDGRSLTIDGAINNGQPMDNHQVVGDGSRLPATQQPANSSADLLNPDGSVKQRRYYDADGKAQMDIDFNHSDDGTHEFPHIHIWDWSKNPPRQDSRR